MPLGEMVGLGVRDLEGLVLMVREAITVVEEVSDRV